MASFTSRELDILEDALMVLLTQLDQMAGVANHSAFPEVTHLLEKIRQVSDEEMDQ